MKMRRHRTAAVTYSTDDHPLGYTLAASHIHILQVSVARGESVTMSDLDNVAIARLKVAGVSRNDLAIGGGEYFCTAGSGKVYSLMLVHPFMEGIHALTEARYELIKLQLCYRRSRGIERIKSRSVFSM